MTIEYCIEELRRYEYEVDELITNLKESLRDYKRTKECYPESMRRYIEIHFKDLKGISSRLYSDAEELDALDKLCKQLNEP